MNRDDQALMFRMPDNHLNDDPVPLTPDQQAAALTFLQKLHGAVSAVYDDVKKNTLKVSTRFNCVGLMESHVADIGKILGSDADKKQSEELRNNQLRTANIEIARLEAEIAKGVTPEAVGHKLKALHDTVYRWWHVVGFGYVEGSFSDRYYKVKFSCFFDTLSSLHEMEPVTKKEKLQKRIQEVGELADLVPGRNEDDAKVLDTPKSRGWILAQIRARFPGFRLLNIRSHTHSDNIYSDETCLREIEGYIPLSDIEEEIEDGSEQTPE